MKPDAPPAAAHAARSALETALGTPFLDGNRVQLLQNGDEIFPAMLEAISAARRSILIVTFVYWTGDIARRFAEALAERARAGVHVALVLDAVGAAPMDPRLVTLLEEAGVELVWFRPKSSWRVWRLDHRTHRKLLVCDGRVGFTGGVGIAEQWEGDARDPGEWRETHVRLEGPVVEGLIAGFIGNWVETGRPLAPILEVLADRPDPDTGGDVPIGVVRSGASFGWSDVATLFHVLIGAARTSLRLTTPYFVPDDESVRLLCDRAAHGVEVDVLLPSRHVDSRLPLHAGRRRYAELLEAGVRIREYEHTMLHCKVLTVDGRLACLGSANVNHRSLLKDDELCVVLDAPALAGELDRRFDDDATHARLLDAAGWARRGPLARLLERGAGLLARMA